MNHSQLFKQTILPGVTVLVAATGNKLFVRTAAQPFKVKFDNGSTIELEDGFSFTSDELFSRLEVTNPNAASLYVEFYVGDATITRTAPLYMRDALTTIGPLSGIYNLAAPNSVTPVFPGASAGKHRKEIIIGNRSSVSTNAVELFIDTIAVGTIAPGTSFVLPTNGAVQLRHDGNPSAIPLDVYVLELLYV